jgi:hypothetical protein
MKYRILGLLLVPLFTLSCTQTGLFVPEWGELFAVAQGQGGQSAEIRVYEAN